MMTDASGNIVWQCTYTPFGAELNCPAAPTHYKFTGKERDAETNLDYFGERYFNSSPSRWMSPDWGGTSGPVPFANFTDPQTLNLYGYLRNNPTGQFDSDGHEGNNVFNTDCDAATDGGDGGCFTSSSTSELGAVDDQDNKGPLEVGESVRRGQEAYSFLTGLFDKWMEASKLKDELDTDTRIQSMAFGIVAANGGEGLNRFPQAIEIYRLEEQNLILDMGRQVGKVMSEVPSLPGTDKFGDAVFNDYGRQRDENNARIDELPRRGRGEVHQPTKILKRSADSEK